jgi:hypothetical protein
MTYITEQCGARWSVEATGGDGVRAFWVFLAGGRSTAKPDVIGFYASSIESACDALNN